MTFGHLTLTFNFKLARVMDDLQTINQSHSLNGSNWRALTIGQQIGQMLCMSSAQNMSSLFQGENDLTELLLRRLNSSGRVHMVPASFKGKYVIRFTVTSQYTTENDITRDWSIIQETARRVLAEEDSEEEVSARGV